MQLTDLDDYTLLIKLRNQLWSGIPKSRPSVLVGAGFSRNAEPVYPGATLFPLWSELIERMAGELESATGNLGNDFLKIAQIYSDYFGREKLEDFIRASIPDSEYRPGTLHSTLLKMP